MGHLTNLALYLSMYLCMYVSIYLLPGKPVLGDVWNTSPSSSELSSYSPWRDGDGEGCYSREITPSDDGGGCGFYDTRERLSHGGNNTNPFRSLLNSDEDEDAYREPTAWSLGGEIIGGQCWSWSLGEEIIGG